MCIKHINEILLVLYDSKPKGILEESGIFNRENTGVRYNVSI